MRKIELVQSLAGIAGAMLFVWGLFCPGRRPRGLLGATNRFAVIAAVFSGILMTLFVLWRGRH
jgi:hypothetical protein